MRYAGPKNRLARREGADLGMKTLGTKSHSNLMRKLNIIPGQHGTKRARKQTDYGVQLRQKQRLKRIYGLSERQMRNYFIRANKTLGNTAEILFQNLETRLDNVVYRLGFAPTRMASRQLVNHGHMLVNGKKASIPSYHLRAGDLISFKKEKSIEIPYLKAIIDKKDLAIPDWLERKAIVGKIITKPTEKHFSEDVDLQQVIEFYSR